MPMDYDENEFNIHNVELAEEGSSTVSPVLRPYDYEDGGDLRFDSLVENEVFLGITGQEDNQWIEEYSRGTSSSLAESRRDNVWSEATSSESVEMLLKSVGQGALMSDLSNEPGSLLTNMDPNLKQDNEDIHAREAIVTNKEEEWALATEELAVSDEPGSLSIIMDNTLKQDDECNLSQEAMATNKEEEGAFATKELDVSDEPGNLAINMDPVLNPDDGDIHAHEEMVTNKEEEGTFATKELDVSDDAGSLAIIMDPNLKHGDGKNHSQEALVTNKEMGALVNDSSNEPGTLVTSTDPNLNQGDEDNHAREAIVTNNEEEGDLAIEELDVSDEPGSLSINTDDISKLDDESDHAQETMVPNKEEGVAFATKELDVSDEPGCLAINVDPSLRQDDGNIHAQEEMVSYNEEEGTLATEELDVSDEPGNLGINMDPNLKPDDGGIPDHEEMVTNKEEEGTFATKELDVSDESGSLAIIMDLNLKHADGNNHAQGAMVTNKEMGALVTDSSNEPGTLVTNMDPSLKQDDEDNHTREATVTNNEEEGDLAIEELDASDEPGSLTINTDDHSKQDDESDHAQEAMVPNKEEGGPFATKELDISDQPGSLAINMDPNLKQDDGNIHAQEEMVSYMDEEGTLATEELDVSDEPGNLGINMDPNLKPDDGGIPAHEEMVTDKEEDGTVATKELDASDESGSLAINMDPNLKQDAGQVHAQEEMVTQKEEHETFATIELDASDESGSLAINMDPNMKQDAGKIHAEEEMVTQKEEQGTFATIELNVSDEPGSLAINMDSNLKQDDGNDHAQEAMVTNKEVGAMVTEELYASDDPGELTTYMDPNLRQDDGNNHAHKAMLINMHQVCFSGSVSFDCQKIVIDTFTKDSQDETKISGLELDSDVLANKYDLSQGKEGGAFAIEELEVNDEPGSLAINMDPSLEQDDGNNHAHDEMITNDSRDNFSGSNASYGCEKVNVTIKKGSQEAKVSGVESDSDVLDCDLSEEKADVIRDDINHVARNIAVDLFENKLQDPSTSRIECVNLDASKDCKLNLDVKFPPIHGGMSSVHHDSEVKKEGFISDGTCENESCKVAGSMIDCASLSVVETGASPDSAGEVVHGESVENMNAIMNELAHEANSGDLGGRSAPSTVDGIPCDSSAKVGDGVEAGDGIQESISGHYADMSTEKHASTDMVLTSECDDSQMRHEEDRSFSMDTSQSVSPLSNTNNSELSQSKRVEPSEGAVNENASLLEAPEDVVLTSEFVDGHMRHEEDRSVSVDKLQSVSLLSNTNATELSQSTRVKPSEGAIIEDTSLSEATEDVQGKEHLISLNSDMKIDESFTFEGSATAELDETGNSLQLFPASQACNLSRHMEGPCTDSSSTTLDPRKPNEARIVTPQTPSSGTIHVGVKERKPRRKSVGKESVKKAKETTTLQSARVDKSSPLLVSPQTPTAAVAAGHFIQFQELRHKEECSATKPIPISNLPDLNNATCIFHQPFTNNQQVQLRAQILVYGSLISGTPPEEPYMIAAFGQSDAERKTWEAAWHACLERIDVMKTQANSPAIQQPPSGHRTPDLGIKHSSTLSSSNMGTPAAASPLIPVPSPLWNMFTPSCVDFQSRSAAFQQSYTPIHPPTYQTPPNPAWLSQSPYFRQWGVASSPPPSTSRLSALPIIEAVKLTPVKASGGGPHAYSMPVGDSTVFPSLSTNGKKASCDSKSRKRKKATAPASSVLSQALMTPPIAHQVPHAVGHDNNCISFLVENQTESVTAPVITGVFTTPVTVSVPPAPKSSSPDRFFSFHDHSLGDKKVGNADDILLKKVEEGNMQEADVNATKTWQLSSDSRRIKRTKVTTISSVNQTPISTPAPLAVTCLPQVHGSEISLLVQNQTVSVPAPVFSTPVPTSAALYSAAYTHGYPRTGYENMEHALAVQETLSKVRESKLQAENAALLAAAELSNCQDLWSMLDSQNNSAVVSNPEAMILSSVAAAASVAKMASAAAKIASNVAEQAKLMADEVFLSSKPENFNHISHPNVINKDTPASILKGLDKRAENHPNSIICAAREAARQRIKAASAASKHAENLDAIVKAAELAAETVSHVGKIAAMHDSSILRKLAEAGPEGFWKISQLSYEQHEGGDATGLHLNDNSCKKNVAGVFIDEIQTLKHGLSTPVHLAHNQMMVGIGDGSITGNEKDNRTSIVPNLSKPVGVSTEAHTRSPHIYVVGHNTTENTTCFWEEHNIKEGCLVEVYKEDGKYKGAWLAANVLSLKDNKALVCYTAIRSLDEGSKNVKEWVAFEVEGSEAVPRIRIAHPMTTMQFEGARKRRRTWVTDYAWSKGDRVDAWMQDCWREGVVTEANETDATSLTVQFPAKQGETSVVRSWHVRPTLIWKDRKWIEWIGCRASQGGDTPKEKRMKIGSPVAVNDKMKDKLPMIVESGRHEEQGTRLPLLSSQDSCFNVGKSTNKHSSGLRTIQKERAKVVFGVPKPGKKQKFMAVSTQYVDDRSNKNHTTNGSIKFSKPPDTPKSKTYAIENQVTETKPRFKPRKPPVPSFRTVTSRDSHMTDAVENSSSRQNQTPVGSSSNKSKDPAKGPTTKKAFTFTSKPRSEHFNRGKLQVAPKVEVKDESSSQVNEPRRSNRKIQPTSRLLEGLQSSLTISKIPSISHPGLRKMTPKGNSNHD